MSLTLRAELEITPADQIITFHPPIDLHRDAGRIPLDVSASSGLPVTLTVDDPLVATVEGTELVVHRVGTIQITASQAGDGNYTAADPVTVTVRVTLPDGEKGPGPDDLRGLRVHQAVSPNGDGINDFLMIEGIRDYPENRVIIFNRNGTALYEAKGYDNQAVRFVGTGRDGKLLPTGTYYYIVEVKDGGVWKHQKGFIVVRY